jgi:hypothetical protein
MLARMRKSSLKSVGTLPSALSRDPADAGGAARDLDQLDANGGVARHGVTG